MSHSPDDAVPRVETNHDYERGWKELSRLVDEGRSFSGREPHCCFLNTGNGQFADVSAVTGLNAIDDGRGVAVVDWDADGDLDLWVTNRTAPMVRYFRNDCDESNQFVSLKLVGTECNRDAVGARVELLLNDNVPDASDDPDRSQYVKTVYCGRGFLSQSSKWIHFGLEHSASVRSVSVRWPGGEAETFTGIEPGHRHCLVQGTGHAERLPERIVSPRPTSPGWNAEAAPAARVVLYHRPELPKLRAVDFNGEPLKSRLTSGQPVLVSFWATWCRPCVEELQNWASRESEISSHTLQILAVNVEGAADGVPDQPQQQATELLDRMKFPFPAGTTDRQFLDDYSEIERDLFGRISALSLPTSLLVDSQGQIAVVYRGSVSLDQVLADLQVLDAPPADLRNHAAAFSGRWALSVVDTRESPVAASDIVATLLEQPVRLAILVLLLVGYLVFIIHRLKSRLRRKASAEPETSNSG